MRIQLWSYNFDPEPMGIGPLSGSWARAMAERGHDVLVVAAHPHYPSPAWGSRLRPYRERRDGIPVLRLPIWAGRATGLERIRQELSFTVAQTLVGPLLPRPDVLVAVSPSFPALAPAMAQARLWRVPWVLWVQDILPDGAVTTDIVSEGPLIEMARRFERAAYASASRVVVISDAFARNLAAKGVPDEKLVRIYNQASFGVPETDPERRPADPPRVVCMGNIGRTQGLDQVVPAFEASEELARLGVELRIVGAGVAEDEVRAQITTGRVSMPGVLVGDALRRELEAASLGAVTQRSGLTEFNLPSKLMNYLALGLPVVASLDPDSEAAAIVRDSGAGWVADCTDPEAFPATVAAALRDPEGLEKASVAATRFAREHLSPQRHAARFEAVVDAAVADGRVSG